MDSTNTFLPPQPAPEAAAPQPGGFLAPPGDGRAHWLRRWGIWAAAVLAVTALVAAGWVAAQRLTALAEADRWEAHSRLVQLQLEQFSGALFEAESAQRGYVITGHEQHLETYAQAVREARVRLAALMALTADNPTQQMLLATLDTTVQAKLASMEDNVRLRRTQGPDAARANVERVWNRGDMAQIQRSLDAATAEEQRLLDLRSAAKAADAARTVRTLAAGGLLATLTLLAVLASLRLEVGRRRRSEAALQAHRDQLEATVAARTQALEQARSRQRLFIEHAPAALAMFDRDMRYLAVSRRWLRDYGQDDQDPIGRSHYELFPEIPEAWKAVHRRALAGEVVMAEADRFERADGSVQWLRWEVRPWHDDRGVVGGIVVFTEEITARRQAETALAAAKQRLEHYNSDLAREVQARTRELEQARNQFRDFVLRAPIAMCFVGHDGRITMRNEQFLAVLGHDEQAVPDLAHWWTRVYPDAAYRGQVRTQWLQHMDEAARARRAVTPAEYRVCCADGRERDMEISGVTLEQGFLATFVDVTQRRAVEAELEVRRHEAEAASQAKSDFLANMSHEIRTPMNAVLGLAYLLQKQPLPEEAATLVLKIRSAGRSLLGIINDILDYSKIESGRLELEHAPFRLGDVLDNLAVVMATTAHDKALELTIHPPPAWAEHLCGDALRLEQVLINLTGNAIKFTEQGLVDVDIRIEAEDAQALTLRFAVKDTGIGISAQQQRAIFAPFTQGDASTTRRFGGTGLGLAISRRLVAFMGGELQLCSEPGRGSEFWFSLRLQRSAPPQLSAPEMAGLELVIADDNAIAREALQQTTAHLGWKATLVDSGQAALDEVLGRRARHAAPDVVLLDWQMPGLDGLATARRLRATQVPGNPREPVVIMVSAYTREQLLAQPDSTHVDAVLTKPVTTSSLYNAVARVLQGRGGLLSPRSAAQGPRLQGLHLLVVDDSDLNREVAQRIFSDEGARVTQAADGRQALQWLQAHGAEVDLVLMDVQMPHMDGYEATRAIRRLPSLATLPVVALTAGAFQAQQEAARAAGMDDFIAKPFDVAAAVALIQRLTGCRGAEAPAAAPASAAPQAADAASPALPGLSVAQGLRIWKEPAAYAQVLRRFAHEHGDDARHIAAAPAPQAAALAHRLQGVAGNLGLEAVAAAAAALESALRMNSAPAQPLPAPLQQALDTALASIERFASAALAAPRPSPPELPAHATPLPALLGRLQAAWDGDDPAAIEPLLSELARVLPPPQLAPLEQAVRDYDFRGGEAATRALLQALGDPPAPASS